jgi:hypothetical protein
LELFNVTSSVARNARDSGRLWALGPVLGSSAIVAPFPLVAQKRRRERIIGLYVSVSPIFCPYVPTRFWH